MKKFLIFAIGALVLWCFSRFCCFRSVNAIRVSPNRQPALVSFKPTRKFFKYYAAGREYSLVHLGSGYYAFYVVSPELPAHFFENINIYSEIILLRKRRGKFVSIDLADKTLLLLLKKINCEV